MDALRRLDQEALELGTAELMQEELTRPLGPGEDLAQLLVLLRPELRELEREERLVEFVDHAVTDTHEGHAEMLRQELVEARHARAEPVRVMGYDSADPDRPRLCPARLIVTVDHY